VDGLLLGLVRWFAVARRRGAPQRLGPVRWHEVFRRELRRRVLRQRAHVHVHRPDANEVSSMAPLTSWRNDQAFGLLIVLSGLGYGLVNGVGLQLYGSGFSLPRSQEWS